MLNGEDTLMRGKISAALLAAGLLTGCGASATPVAQTVTSMVPTTVRTTVEETVATTEQVTELATTVETTTATETIVTTVPTTVTYDPVAASKTAAAASSKAAAEAAKKKGQEGLDAQAKAAGINVGKDWDSPAGYCESVRAIAEPDNQGISLDEWLDGKNADELAYLKLVVKNICPGYQADLDRGMSIVQLKAEKKYTTGGTKLVPSELVPGTYQTVDTKVEDCYWEYVDSSGEIMDNNFINGSAQFSITIPESASAFTSRGCGGFMYVG